MQHQGAGRGKRMSQGKRGEERANHDTAPSTKGITRMKVRQALLKSLGTHIARSPHYHVLGPSLICLSPQVSLAIKYLASRKHSIEYHFHTVSLEEH
jgi:hypothetical protein